MGPCLFGLTLWLVAHCAHRHSSTRRRQRIIHQKAMLPPFPDNEATGRAVFPLVCTVPFALCARDPFSQAVCLQYTLSRCSPSVVTKGGGHRLGVYACAVAPRGAPPSALAPPHASGQPLPRFPPTRPPTHLPTSPQETYSHSPMEVSSTPSSSPRTSTGYHSGETLSPPPPPRSVITPYTTAATVTRAAAPR